MDWETVKIVLATGSTIGIIVIAAAKSMFVTKREVYGTHGNSLYVLHSDWRESRMERDQRHDAAQVSLCKQIETMVGAINEVRKGQEQINISISRLQALYEEKNK